MLEDIPGVGPARIKALMRHFKSIEEIKQADVAALSEVPEIPEHIAQEIYSFFRKDEKQTSHENGDMLK